MSSAVGYYEQVNFDSLLVGVGNGRARDFVGVHSLVRVKNAHCSGY